MSIISKLVLIFILCSTAFGEDMKVLFKKGKVQKINLENKKLNIDSGDVLVEGDILLTGEDSFVVVTLKGHSTHKLEQNSQITILSLPYYFKGSKELDQGASFLLKAGTIFSDVVTTEGVKSLTIKSNNTVMGVRGTKFLASREEETQNVWLLVKSGEVEIHNELSGDKDILITEQGVVVENDRTFTGVKRYEILKELSWDMSPASVFNSFAKKKQQALSEYSQKKTKWNRNEVIYSQKEKRWNREQRDYEERTKSLKSVKIKKRRKAQIKESINKSPKDLARGIKNKNKIRRNDFLELRQKRKIQRKLDQNDLKDKRKNNRPKPTRSRPTDSSTN